ncbi:unnamed protein product, partial [Prorocentrum cordatum]
MAVTWQDAEQDAAASRAGSGLARPARAPKRADSYEDDRPTPTVTSSGELSWETRARTLFRSASRACTKHASNVGASIPLASRFVSFWRPSSDARALLLRVGACLASGPEPAASAAAGLLVVASLGCGGKA